jgi:hypothetical protein
MMGIHDCATALAYFTQMGASCDMDLSAFGISFTAGNTLLSVCPHACGTCG